MRKTLLLVGLVAVAVLLAGCVGPPADSHTECANQQCARAIGPGTDQCTADADCATPPPETHFECQGPACVEVQGTGTDQCATNAECQQGFQPSEVICEINPVTGKSDWCYCSYDETRYRVAIIIKENGTYDEQGVIAKFAQYFTAVKNHLNIDNAGVKKFGGATAEEFDRFIEGLAKNEMVGYAIIVGMDLPVVVVAEDDSQNPKTGEWFFGKGILDLDNVNNIYSYVERSRNDCKDIALSFVFAPRNYNESERRDFVVSVFSNFVDHHSDFQATIGEFSQSILIDVWDDNLSDIGGEIKLGWDIGLDPEKNPEYTANLYFYTPVFALNSDPARINSEFKNKHLLLMYYVHGGPDIVGLGFHEPVRTTSTDIAEIYNQIYTSNQDVLDFYESNGKIFLFVDVLGSCNADVLYAYNANKFCCWPQAWLNTGAWVVFDVGNKGHYSFERWAYNEKVIGKALRKTHHNQGMVYGDILATLP